MTMLYPDFVLVPSTVLDTMPQEQQFTLMGLVYDVIVAGKLPGVKPGYGAALQAHLDNVNNMLKAIDAAKVVYNTDTEEGAL
ncbi:hypothetical protein B0H14DRAFT_3510584 [Mycena olivaceomarginata]|nr:hypothetical protein B0H14DRAFT_3510584 [Mycena olivaceomarginata]